MEMVYIFTVGNGLRAVPNPVPITCVGNGIRAVPNPVPIICVGNGLCAVPNVAITIDLCYNATGDQYGKTRKKKIRIREYDYGQEGCYFVTLCTHNRASLFKMEQSAGNSVHSVSDAIQNRLIHKWIQEMQNKFPNISVDKYVIMRDHLHLLITIKEYQEGASLSDIMQFFKTMTTNEYIRGVKEGVLPPFDRKLWQKSYYDHVIRNFQDYREIWEYIENNPAKWKYIHEKT